MFNLFLKKVFNIAIKFISDCEEWLVGRVDLHKKWNRSLSELSLLVLSTQVASNLLPLDRWNIRKVIGGVSQEQASGETCTEWVYSVGNILYSGNIVCKRKMIFKCERHDQNRTFGSLTKGQIISKNNLVKKTLRFIECNELHF